MVLFSVISNNYLYGNENPLLVEKDRFKIEKIATGLTNPSDMEIIGDDILVTELNNADIRLIRDYDLKKYPIFSLRNSIGMENKIEGITSVQNDNSTSIFILAEENSHKDSIFSPKRNSTYIFKYMWNGSGLRLENPETVFENPTPSIDDKGKLENGFGNHLFFYNGVKSSAVAQSITSANQSPKSFVSNQYNMDTVLDSAINKANPIENTSPMIPSGNSSYKDQTSIFDLSYDNIGSHLWIITQGSDGKSIFRIIGPEHINVTDKEEHSNKFCCSTFNFRLNNQQIHEIVTLPSRTLKSFPFGDQNFSSIAFADRSFHNSPFVNTIFLGNSNGSLFQFGLGKSRESLYDSGDIQKNLLGKNFGSIVDLEIDDNAILYILSLDESKDAHGNDRSGSVFAITLDNKVNILRHDTILKYDYAAITIILAIVFILSGILGLSKIRRFIHR